MERLTRGNPENNLQTLLNYAYAKDGKVKLSYADGEYGADLCEYISAKSKDVSCGLCPSPKEVQEGACMECDCELGLLYLIAIQAAELRARLMRIEDVLGDEYDLEDIRKKIEGVEIDQFNNWIPVTERLPGLKKIEDPDGDDWRESEFVLVTTASKEVREGRFWKVNDQYGWTSRDDVAMDITHWMPLPEPPKGVG